MITSYNSRHLDVAGRRGSIILPRRRLWLLVTATLLTIGGFILAEIPSEAGTGCGEASAPRCTFVGPLPEVGPEEFRIAGKPHLYSRLVTPLSFTDPTGAVWTAPRATLTDGASIPPVFVPLIGDPRSAEFLAPAALHDAYCGAGNEALAQFRARSWEETHRMFYYGLRAAGVPRSKAKVMFAAVYLGGPRWNDPARALDTVPDEILRREMEACLRFIERDRPSLAELEAWMRRRETAILSETSVTAP